MSDTIHDWLANKEKVKADTAALIEAMKKRMEADRASIEKQMSWRPIPYRNFLWWA